MIYGENPKKSKVRRKNPRKCYRLLQLQVTLWNLVVSLKKEKSLQIPPSSICLSLIPHFSPGQNDYYCVSQ
jgi:hypothetical protein